MTHFHAPEPWTYHWNGATGEYQLRDAQDFPIEDMSSATAERIVQCINACTGIETTDLKEVITAGKRIVFFGGVTKLEVEKLERPLDGG